MRRNEANQGRFLLVLARLKNERLFSMMGCRTNKSDKRPPSISLIDHFAVKRARNISPRAILFETRRKEKYGDTGS
jgi:hypothetical protein